MKKSILFLLIISALCVKNARAQYFINFNQQKILTLLKADTGYTSPKVTFDKNNLVRISTYNVEFDITTTFILNNDSCVFIGESIPAKYFGEEKESLNKNNINLTDNVWIDKDKQISIILKPIPEDSVFFKSITLINSLKSEQ